ncbi:uncharacterized protein LOC143038528 [Oratosquilla oratoria]|uniref:uncharacterized protein LOC143038528 n=1 Tax=Oratosquilla oratoria TaxID=337810 RepID=UPI003F777090
MLSPGMKPVISCSFKYNRTKMLSTLVHDRSNSCEHNYCRSQWEYTSSNITKSQARSIKCRTLSCISSNVIKKKSKRRIQDWVDPFENYGTVENFNAASENRPSHSGSSRKHTAELVKGMKESVQQSLKLSVRERS